MNRYPGMTIKSRLAAAAIALTVVAGLLETVAGGFLYPDADAQMARRQTIAAQADQVARARALAEGQVKSAAADAAPRM